MMTLSLSRYFFTLRFFLMPSMIPIYTNCCICIYKEEEEGEEEEEEERGFWEGGGH